MLAVIIKPVPLSAPAKDFPNAKFAEVEFLKAIAPYMCKHSSIEFGTCNSGQGEQGKHLLNLLNEIFGANGNDVDVILHTGTVKIWAWGVSDQNGEKTPRIIDDTIEGRA